MASQSPMDNPELTEEEKFELELARDLVTLQTALQQCSSHGRQAAEDYECSSVGQPSMVDPPYQAGSYRDQASIAEDVDSDELSVDEDDDEPIEPTVENTLLVNQAYQDALIFWAQRIEQVLAQNQEQQQHIQMALDQNPDIEGRLVTKVPVQMYLPPYFKDSAGMCPPPNSDTIKKAQMGEFDPLVEVPKKWNNVEKPKLLKAVRQSLMELKLKPLENRLDIVNEKLENPDLAAAEKEVQQEKKKQLKFEINQIKGLADTEMLAPPYDEIDWVLISVHDFKGTRTPLECQLFWQNEMRPGLNQQPQKWTEDEEEKLRAVVKAYENANVKVDWNQVAIDHGNEHGRTAFQCFERYQSKAVLESIKRKPWSKDEDSRLSDIVDSCRMGDYVDWDQVSYQLEGRTRGQCQLRYTRVLNSTVTKGRWSELEDQMLMSGVKEYGMNNWPKVSKVVQTRNGVQCRERWVSCMDVGLKSGPWTKEEDEKLKLAVKMFGPGNWAKCRGLVEGRTPSSCKVRYKILTHTRIQYPRAKLVNGQLPPRPKAKGGPKFKVGPQKIWNGLEKSLIPFEKRLYRCAAVATRRQERLKKLEEVFNGMGGTVPDSVLPNSNTFVAKSVGREMQPAFKRKLGEIHQKFGNFERDVIESKDQVLKSVKTDKVENFNIAKLHQDVENLIRASMQRYEHETDVSEYKQTAACREILKTAMKKPKVKCCPPTLTTVTAYKDLLDKQPILVTMAKNVDKISSAAADGSTGAQAKTSTSAQQSESETSQGEEMSSSAMVAAAKPGTSKGGDGKSKNVKMKSLAKVKESAEFQQFFSHCRSLFLWPAIIADLKAAEEGSEPSG